MSRDPSNKPASNGRKPKAETAGRQFKSKAQDGTADWANCDAEELLATICSVGYRGGALRLGYTSDGGAYSIGIYGDGEPYTHYVRPGEDITGVIRELRAYFESE